VERFLQLNELPMSDVGQSPTPWPSQVVTVLASSNPASVIMAKLLLEAEGIRFVTEGEGVQDFFGIGRLDGGYNPFTGPVQLRVASENVFLALDALRAFRGALAADGRAAMVYLRFSAQPPQMRRTLGTQRIAPYVGW
jgi:hypothetical protein